MFCPFCGKEMRDGAVFCPQCGKNTSTGNMKPGVAEAKVPLFKNKKFVVLASLIIIAVIIILCITAGGSQSIVGTWENSKGGEISFSEGGRFEYSKYYGTYTIYDDKKLGMIYQDWNKLGDNTSYEWSEAASEDSSCWYISGDTLYLGGKKYTKKK